MKIKFWGTRGSLPAPLNAHQVRDKILRALTEARSTTLPADEAGLEAWVDERLPFNVRGTCGGNTSCVQIIAGGNDYVLLDAGSGLSEFARRGRLPPNSADTHPGFPRNTTFHVVLSHLHWDHVQGLPFFIPLYVPGQKVVFYGVHDTIEQAVRAQFSAPSFPVEYEHLKAQISYRRLDPAQPTEIAGISVRLFEHNHPGISYGFRFEHGGRVFVYSTDCEHKQPAASAPDYPYVKHFADADLLIFDAMYSLEEATFDKADWGHSSNVMGVELAARARVKRLALFHHDPAHNDGEMAEILFNTRMYAELYHQGKARQWNGANKYPSEVLLAYDGLEVAL